MQDNVYTEKSILIHYLIPYFSVSHPSYEHQNNGMVLTMGQGDCGQLGLGDEILERKRPAIVADLQGTNVVQIVCGGMHTVALSSDGQVCVPRRWLKSLKGWKKNLFTWFFELNGLEGNYVYFAINLPWKSLNILISFKIAAFIIF